MFLELEFEELEGALDLEFEQVTEISDGGFDRGFEEGYKQGNTDGYATGKTEGESIGFADALAKRTELVVTDSGEYEPTGESTGFKKVIVGIQKGEDLDAVIAEQAELIGELSATLDEKIGAYDVGYDAALEKLTDLVATENGDYTPPEGSTGFKSVNVNVQAEGGGENKLVQVINQTVTEITEDDLIGAKRMKSALFFGCANLKKAVVPGTARVIEVNVFKNCTALEDIEIQEGVEEIGINCFYGCSSLQTITFPKTTKTIGSDAFPSTPALKTLIVKATTPPTLQGSLGADHGVKEILVPVGCLGAYRMATNWVYVYSLIREDPIAGSI